MILLLEYGYPPYNMFFKHLYLYFFWERYAIWEVSHNNCTFFVLSWNESKTEKRLFCIKLSSSKIKIYKNFLVLTK